MAAQTNVTIIGGCGHVGLPLGIILADLGQFSVTLLDVDQEKIDIVNSGTMPFWEMGMDPVLKRVVGKNLRATKDLNCLKTTQVAITVIGTPVDRHLNPHLGEINRHADETIDRLPDDAVLILRSTLYPGVTKLIYDRIKSKNRRIHLAVCPERIVEGRALEEMPVLPQIVAAFDDESRQRAADFFKQVVPTVIYADPIEAEFGKLMCNSWRYLDFAIANQFFILCQRYGLDFYRIYDTFRHEYPRMSTWPKAGLTAGPCLLKDTLQMSAFSNNLFSFGQVAMTVNESMPNFIIEKLQPLGLSERTVAILGMAFKGDSDDKRDSLAYKLRNLLQVYAKEVLCTDPYVPDERLVAMDEAIKKADIIILGAPHSIYKDVKIPSDKVLIDVFGFFPRTPVETTTLQADQPVLTAKDRK